MQQGCFSPLPPTPRTRSLTGLSATLARAGGPGPFIRAFLMEFKTRYADELLELTLRYGRLAAQLLQFHDRRATAVPVMCMLLLCQPHPASTFLEVLEVLLPQIRLLKQEAARFPGAEGPGSAKDALFGISMYAREGGSQCIRPLSTRQNPPPQASTPGDKPTLFIADSLRPCRRPPPASCIP